MDYIISKNEDGKWLIKERSSNYGRDLSQRLFQFSVDLVKYLRMLPNNEEVRNIKRQLFKAGTSMAANYEEAQGAISKDDFSSKCGIVLKESKESNFWLRLIKATDIDNSETLDYLTQETKEYIAIFTSIQIKTRPRKF